MVTLRESESTGMAEAGTGAQGISKAQLKARMLEIFRRLEREGNELIVTDRGRPVLRITPIRKKIPAEVLFAKERKAIAEGKMPFPTREQLLAPLDSSDYEVNTDWSLFQNNKAKKRAKR
ncbi:MAG: hypothetical protein NZL89_02890 [Leptospiraceae bacterium]|nr:hypothetical protein [Leptospiraceae bacterium]